MRDRVRQARREHDWSQTQLADQIGVSRQAINAIEQGRSTPTLVVALKLGRALGKTIDELFGHDREVEAGVRVAPPSGTQADHQVRTADNGSKPRAESARD